MIKLKELLAERLTQYDYDGEIEKLQSEWEKADEKSLPTIDISKRIEKLQKLKSNWEKLYKATM